MVYRPEYDIAAPDFEADRAYGEQGEQLVREFMAQLAMGAVEVKTDRYRNGYWVVETQQETAYGWRPSGLNVTEAVWWVYQYHLHGAFTMVAVDRLKRYLRVNYDVLTKREFGARGDNRTRGYLLTPHQITDLLTSKNYDPKGAP